MPNHYTLSLLLIPITWFAPAFSQIAVPDSTVQSTARFNGIGLDVFPLLNGIFSDDSNTDLFTFNFIWGYARKHFEFGISPRFSQTNSDTEDSKLTMFGAGIRFFHGNTRSVSRRWFVTFGMTYEYRFLSDKSVLENGDIFKFHTRNHAAGLGPQLMFGFRIDDKVWVRSRIAGLLQYTLTRTTIMDGNNIAANQKIKNFHLDISLPTILEMVYIF